MTRTCLSLVLLAAAGAYALDFDVISIRPADPGERRSSMSNAGGENLTVTNKPARTLIQFAYDLRDFQLEGVPGWAETETYNIVAKAGASQTATPDLNRTRERVRALLAERFGLIIHHETKEKPAYDLGIAKNGPHLHAPVPAGDQRGTYISRGKLEGFAATTAQLAKEIANITGRPVTDATSLVDPYDFVLQWSQEEDASGPTIFTALQEQLGLRLEARKKPVDVIVIDQIHRPSEN